MPGTFVPDEPYPANEPGVESREILVGRERVRVVESGAAGSFPVVLLHGWGASAYNFHAILGRLADAGFRAIAPDLRGHGWSETAFPAGSWTREAMTDWVRQLLDVLGVRRCVLVGQSIGGAVALDAAAAMPDRVAALVLLAPIGFTPVRRVVVARRLRWWHPSTTPRWVVSLILRRIYGRRGHWTEDDLMQYWTPLRRSDVVRALLQSVREFDFTPRDPRMLLRQDCPVVIRFGELDRLIPHKAALRHARGFANAEASVLEGVGHVPAEEVPDEVAEVILHTARLVVSGEGPEERPSGL